MAGGMRGTIVKPPDPTRRRVAPTPSRHLPTVTSRWRNVRRSGTTRCTNSIRALRRPSPRRRNLVFLTVVMTTTWSPPARTRIVVVVIRCAAATRRGLITVGDRLSIHMGSMVIIRWETISCGITRVSTA